MNILVYNIKCIKHPDAGGSEVFTHQVLKRLVMRGHNVTLYTSEFRGSKKIEELDGINIIRNGGLISSYLFAENYYTKNFKNKFDIVIDEYTYKPFMTPKFVKEPIIFLVHELAREKWFYATKFPLSYFGRYIVEPYFLSVYKNIHTVTVSESTKHDLKDLGYLNVSIVPEGIEFQPFEHVPTKEEKPTFLFVGLLKKVNLADHVIKAFDIIKNSIPDARLWIVGKGPQLDDLKKISQSKDITFFGYVSEQKKIELMSKAHILLMPAIREGWGLVVTEANACGTPAIGYNVHGLRDSIVNNKTGILTEFNDIQKLGETAIDLINNFSVLNSLSTNSLNWSRKFNWDLTTKELESIIINLYNQSNQRYR